MKREGKMKTIDRRSAIKAGLIGAASLPLLHVGNAAAQPRWVSHSGHRVVSRDQNVFGLSSSIITDIELTDLPEPTGVQSIGRNGDGDYVVHVARLLEASYRRSSDSRDDISGDEFHDDVKGILEHEPMARQILVHSESRFYWANVNPWILVVIVPRGVIAGLGIAGLGVGATALTLRPFVDGFLDEAGRSVWRWMWSWFRESEQ